MWKASADVRSEVSGPALRAILDEIQRLQSEKVSEPELAAAKRSIAAGFALSLEDPNQILTYLTLSSIYGSCWPVLSDCCQFQCVAVLRSFSAFSKSALA